jgi:hypothetical protein
MSPITPMPVGLDPFVAISVPHRDPIIGMYTVDYTLPEFTILNGENTSQFIFNKCQYWLMNRSY